MLRAENLVCRRAGRTVLDQLDLRVLPNEIVALVGPDAAGRTAVLEVFAGRLPVASGRALVAGADVAADPAAAFAAAAYVPASPVFAPAVSGLAHLEEVSARLGRRIPAAVLGATLERSGLAPFWHGQRVRDYAPAARRQLAFAAASLKNAPVLLLDEPTADLAPPDVDHLAESLRRLRKRGATILLSTSDHAFARRVATRLVHLEQGTVAATAELTVSRTDHRAESYLSALVG